MIYTTNVFKKHTYYVNVSLPCKKGGGGRGKALVVWVNCFAGFPRHEGLLQPSLTGESWHQAPMCNKVMRGGEAGPGPTALGGKLLRGEAQAGSG